MNLDKIPDNLEKMYLPEVGLEKNREILRSALLNRHALARMASLQASSPRKSFFANFLVKRIVPALGFIVLVVSVALLWNPLMLRMNYASEQRKLLVHAQEMLTLTREQFNALSEVERRNLGEAMQDEGNLQKVWDEAQNASDLRFYTGQEIADILFKDRYDFLKKNDPDRLEDFWNESHDNSIVEEDGGERVTNLFRFTDKKGRIVYIKFLYGVPPKFPNIVIVPEMRIEIERFEMQSLPERTARKPRDFTPEEQEHVRQIIEARIQKYLPDIWEEIKSASSTEFFIEYGNVTRSSALHEKIRLQGVALGRDPDFLVNTVHSKEIMEQEWYPGWYTQEREGRAFLGYELPNGQMGMVFADIDLDFLERVIFPLTVHHTKYPAVRED